MPFPILGRKGLTIEGGGATFLFHEPVTPFVVQDSASVTLRDFTVDCAYPCYTEAVVEDWGERFLRLAIDRERYPFRLEGDPADLVLPGPGGAEFSSRHRCLGLIRIDQRRVKSRDWGVLVAFVFIGDTDASRKGIPAGRLEGDIRETPTGIELRYRPESPTRPFVVGEHLYFSRPMNSNDQSFFFENSSGIAVEGVTVHAGKGIGFLGQMCGDISFDRVSIVPPADRSVSTTADAMHFVQCFGTIAVRDCVISGTLDDALNVHGLYFLADGIPGPDRVSVRPGRDDHRGLVPYRVGDEILFNDPATYRVKGRAVIASVSNRPDRSGIVLGFDRPVEAFAAPGDLVENTTCAAEVIYERNRVADVPEIRLATPRRIVIRDNDFDLCCKDLHFNDLPGYWRESGPTTDVEISGNRFRRPGPNIVFDSERPAEAGRPHRRAVLRGNTFADPGGAVKAVAIAELLREP